MVSKESAKRNLRRLTLQPRPGQNKYELVIVAAKEARHINELARITGEPLPGKVTTIALDRVVNGEVPFTYEEPAPPPAEA